MIISKYNDEGYYDPTAYEGIRNADMEACKLRISYPTGYMEINLEHFFPCTLDKAKKVFSLIYRYSSERDKHKLMKFLQGLENYYANQMEEYAEEAMSYPKKSYEYRKYFSLFKESRRLRQKTLKNFELFIAGRKSNEI
ncbi:hypothetical protein [Clostridium polynesiense]|uniref:hypothetical protein n=1 Tax=Clostridium polynesiense TaxID=1325933 RepID=UPI00058AEE72|nr:hypothetical protein [Clostridium polynesiense]